MAKPLTYKNRFGYGVGYPWVATDANIRTGGSSVVDLGRTVSNGLKLENAGSAGRSIRSLSGTFNAGLWYCIMVEIIDFDLSGYSGTSGANAPLKCGTTGSADMLTSDRILTFDELKAGGPGWYCLMLKFDTTDSRNVFVGLGTDSDVSAAGYITIGRVASIPQVTNNSKTHIPSYPLPGHTCAFNVTGNTIDGNKKITWGTTSIGTIDRFLVIYSIGDSKSDAKSQDTPWGMAANHNIAVYNFGESGQGYDYMVTNISKLQSKLIRNDLEIDRDIFPLMAELPQPPLTPNCLMFSNFGVNDMATYTAAEEVANFVSLAETLGYEDVILTDINPWATGTLGATAAEEAETLLFNAALKAKAREKGWVFVQSYYALGNQPTAPDDLKAIYDAGDGLHMTPEGSAVMDSLIAGALQEFKQRGRS